MTSQTRPETPAVSHTCDCVEAILRALTETPDGVLSRDRVHEVAAAAYGPDVHRLGGKLPKVIRGLEKAGIARRVRPEDDAERWDALVLLSGAAAERTLYRIGQLEDRNEWWRAFSAVAGAGRWVEQTRRQAENPRPSRFGPFARRVLHALLAARGGLLPETVALAIARNAYGPCQENDPTPAHKLARLARHLEIAEITTTTDDGGLLLVDRRGAQALDEQLEADGPGRYEDAVATIRRARRRLP